MAVKNNIVLFLIVIPIGLICCHGNVFAAGNTTDSLTWLWARSGGGASNAAPWKIAVDSSGNVYTIGWFPGQITFGSDTLVSAGDWDVFLAKYDSNGNLIWAKRYGGSGKEEGLGLAIDGNGNLYLAGYYEGTTHFDNYSATSKGDRDIFITKCDSNGNVLWLVSDGGTDLDFAQGLALDATGHIYITGMFTGTASFGTATLISAGQQDAFVVKYDTAGNFIWVKQFGGNGDVGLSWPTGDRGYAIAVDNAGNSYSIGQFNGTANFGSKTLTSAGAQDVYVTKMDSSGNVEWAVRGGGSSQDIGQAVALDGPQKNLCVAGQFQGAATFGSIPITSYGGNDAFIERIDTSGNILWVRNDGGTADDYGLGAAIDERGNCWMSGAFSSTATFGTATGVSQGGLDIFITKYDSTGTFDTLLTAGSPSDDISNDIRADKKGSVYICGFFSGTINFGTNIITSSGGWDIYAAKLKISTMKRSNAIVATTITGFPILTCDSVAFSDAKIWNTGTDTMHITSITITQNNEGFSIASSLTYPIILAPGTDTVIRIRFAPATTGPKTAILNVYSDASNTQVLSTQLSGERDIPTIITASVTVYADSGKPGDTVYLPVIVRSPSPAALSGMGYTALVSYNGSILLPVGIENGTIDSVGNGYVAFTCNNATDTVILICIVGLGDTTSTTLHIDTVEWGGCAVQSAFVNGVFQLTGLCTQGGTRLFEANGTLALSQNVPNPFTGETKIRYSTIEDGVTELYITDVLGRRMMTLTSGYRRTGTYTVVMDGDALQSGIYYYALRTPTQILRKTMVIER